MEYDYGYIIMKVDAKSKVRIANFEKRTKAKLKTKNEKLKILEDIKDSKKLSPKQREQWYEFLTTSPDIKWGVGIVSEKIVDQINILEATKLAMKRALKDLKIEADYLLLDGNFSIQIARVCPRHGGGKRKANAPIRIIPCKAVIKGDVKIWSCAAASIIAKVTRDRLMLKYHQKWPQYGFDKHKGYGTKQHLLSIKQHGPCAIHRRTFRSVL